MYNVIMKKIVNKTFPNERDLYNQKDLHLYQCVFSGDEDGESALKECTNVVCEEINFDLRYPLWHSNKIIIINSMMSETCRASLWYGNDISIKDSKLLGIKALRECFDININNSIISSDEFGWKCQNIICNKTIIQGNYLFFETKDIVINDSIIKGKYNFQYIENAEFNNCTIESKDFFWHAKNVVIKNSFIKGEYLSWYSENLTLINCKISGTQPFCYCKNLKLIDCEIINSDLCFEYSDVEADLIGHIESIKNPKSGYIITDSIGQIILTNDSKFDSTTEIKQRKKLM